MSTRKAELRAIVLDIVFRREHVTYDPSQFGHLALGVAEVMEKRNNPSRYSASVFSNQKELEEGDWLLVHEIFWDLIVERILTIGMDKSNPEYPWFRLHSEAEKKLSKAA